MAAVPSIGRANRVEGAPAPEADLTRALYEEYANQIFRYCLHQLGSREEAEDAVQSTFLNAFRGIQRGIVPELESAWLFKIAHNVCLSRRRSTWRRGRIESPTDFDVVEEIAPAPSRRADELIGLQDVLEQMPEQQRRAILLREWQGLSYREIADELELSQAAVETLIFRARRSLARGLEQPPAAPKQRKRMHAGALGNLLSSAQSFLVGGGAAVKVAAAVAVVSAGTVVATAPVHTHAPAGAHAPVEAKPAVSAPPADGRVGVGGGVAPSLVAGGGQRVASHAHPQRAAHEAPAPTPARVPTGDPASAAPTPAPTPAPPPAVVETPQLQAPARAAPATAAPTDAGKGKDAAPGQLKKNDAAASAPEGASTPVVTPPATTGNGNGKDAASGQQKRNDDATPAPPVAIAAPTDSVVVQTPGAARASQVPAPQGSADPKGSGTSDTTPSNGNGKGPNT